MLSVNEVASKPISELTFDDYLFIASTGISSGLEGFVSLFIPGDHVETAGIMYGAQFAGAVGPAAKATGQVAKAKTVTAANKVKNKIAGLWDDAKAVISKVDDKVDDLVSKSDETGAAVKEVVEETKTLFRGERSSMTPERAFKEGIQPKGTHNDIQKHVTSNSTAGNFTSTSAKKEIAEEFAGKNGYVYEIETSNYVDVNNTLGPESPFPEQMEFSIPGGIKGHEIKGAHKMSKGALTGEFIKNPEFQ